MPLKIVVVGAGLAGLGAAIALNRQGHDIEILEQSGFLNEVGAAIHMAPNATRILKDWGCSLEDLQPVHCNKMRLWDHQGNLMHIPVVTKDTQEALGIYDEWLLTHRVDLHNTLRGLAAKEVNGKKPAIHLRSRVASVDPEAGVVTLEDGTKYTGDLIIGADGMHSRCVSSVIGGPTKKESTGQNCFRFLIPVSKMKSNPLTASLLEKMGSDAVDVFTTEDRRLVVYPCRHGDLLNIAAIHPSGADSSARESSWLDSGNLNSLLETCSVFSPELQEMCKLAEDLKLWSLASRSPPRTFIRGKLALIGDAAHPTLPHQGQGGAQSLEDGAALGALITPECTKDDIPGRLELYNKVRYGRSVTVMLMSKVSDDRRGQMLDELRTYVPDAEMPPDMFSYTWRSYPSREAQQLLRAAQVSA